MKLDDFSRIDLKTMGSLPPSVKAVLLSVMLVFLVGAAVIVTIAVMFILA